MLERSLIAISTMGLLMKLAPVPGAGVIMTLGIVPLSALYIAFGFAIFNDIRLRSVFSKRSYAQVRFSTVVFAMITGLTIALLLLGVLFKLQYWPGASPVLSAGLAVVHSIVFQACFTVSLCVLRPYQRT